MSNIGFLFTVGLFAGTIWLAAMRFRMRLENNWPLVYYLGAVVYLNSYPGTLNPYVAYVAVISALLLRFEFLNERIVLLVRFIEVVALIHVGWSLYAALSKELF